MKELIIGLVVLLGLIWLFGIVVGFLSNFATAVGRQWALTRAGREKVASAVGRPIGAVAETIGDLRLMSPGLAITLFVLAFVLANSDSATLVATLDKIGNEDLPLLGWALAGGIAGVIVSVVSRAWELGWFGAGAVSRVPDVEHLRAGERAAARSVRIRTIAALVGVVFLLCALGFSYSENVEYDRRAVIDEKLGAITAARIDGEIAILNAALEDAAGRLQSDPRTAVKILASLQGRPIEGGFVEVERMSRIAGKYLEAYRTETEKAVTLGKPDALARSDAFGEKDKVASLIWQGRLFEAGRGGADKNLAKAFSYYGEAAKAGDKSAATMRDRVAHTLASSSDEALRQAVFNQLDANAQSGVPSDQYWLGAWYAQSGKAEDLKNAEGWLRKALGQGVDETSRRLAFSSLSTLRQVGAASTRLLDELAPRYATGKDQKMKSVAYAYLEKRAQAGDPGSMLWMGFRYREGDGVAKDEVVARSWLIQAAVQQKDAAVRERAFAALGERNLLHAPAAKPSGQSTTETPPGAVPAGKPAPYVESLLSQPPVANETPKQEQPAPRSVTADVVANSKESISRRPSIPLHSSRQNTVQGWSCDFGYKQVGGECQYVSKPANSSHQYTAQGWSCDFGYKQVGSECQYISKPANSSHQRTVQGWSCDFGYKQVGSECQYVSKPANSSHQWTAQGWSCNFGYKQVGSECQYISKPPNSSHQWTVQGWSCDFGYKQVGSECQYVSKPANASHQWTAQGWSCDIGYKQVGSECLRSGAAR